jgi:hypothetical protein
MSISHYNKYFFIRTLTRFSYQKHPLNPYTRTHLRILRRHLKMALNPHTHDILTPTHSASHCHMMQNQTNIYLGVCAFFLIFFTFKLSQVTHTHTHTYDIKNSKKKLRPNQILTTKTSTSKKTKKSI